MRTYVIETRYLQEVPTAVVFGEVSPDELAEWLAAVHSKVEAYLARVGAGPLGRPFARFHPMGDEPVEVEAGFASLVPVPGEGDIEPSRLPGGPAAITRLVGDTSEIADAYRALDQWITDHRGLPDGDPWEFHCDEGDGGAPWRRQTAATEVVRPYRPAGSPPSPA